MRSHVHVGLSSDLGGDFRRLRDPTPSSAHAGGLGFIIKDSFARQFASVTLAQVGRRGRHAALVCTGPLGAHSTHLDHASARGRRDDMQHIAHRVRRHPLAHHVWGGDMNFITDVADTVAPRQPPAEGDLCGSDAAAFHQSFGYWVELFQPLPTHRGHADGTWATLGRVYSSLPLGCWAGQSTTCRTEGYGDDRGPLSDHCPVCVAWAPTASPMGFPRRVPEWVYK